MDFTKEQEQVMLTLSYIADLGGDITTRTCEASSQMEGMITNALNTQPLVEDWELVWGPGMYRFPLARFYDNLLYVARNKSDPTQYTIVIRGTNSKAVLDWVLEDFWVIGETPWNHVIGKPPFSGIDPKISNGTNLGINILRSIQACPGLPGEGTTIIDFFNIELSSPKTRSATVWVTGHSLGGALSATLALFLNDTQGTDSLFQWDPDNIANVLSIPFAGPTAGNSDFATYTEQRMGGSIQRVINTLDIVPLAWEKDTFATIPDLYQSLPNPIAMTTSEEVLFEAVKQVVKLYNYQQFNKSGPNLTTLNGMEGPPDTYLGQVGYQHVCGYPILLGIPEILDMFPNQGNCFAS